MVGRLEECYLLAYRADPADAARLLPRGLAPMVHEGSAFWNVVLSKVDRMRPIGTPRALGMSYVHVAYRIYVRARAEDGRALEGLHFVRSDVDRPLMALGGNVMTDFRFHASDVSWGTEADGLTLDVRTKDGEGDAHVELDLRPALDAPRPPAYLKYMPLGLSTNKAGTRARLAEVSRDETRWREDPVRVRRADLALFGRMGQKGVSLVAATKVAPLDYRWVLGGSAPLTS